MPASLTFIARCFDPRRRDWQHDPGSEIENDISQGRLMACLSPEHREVLTLTKFIGLSNAEAAMRLSISAMFPRRTMAFLPNLV